MCAAHVRGRDVGYEGGIPAGDVEEQSDAAGQVAQVYVHHATLGGGEASQAHLLDYAQQLGGVGMRTAVVAEGYLAAYHLVDEDEVLGHAGGQRGGGQTIEAGEHVGGDAVLAERLGLGVKLRQGLDEAVGAEQADHGGGTAGDQAAQRHLGSQGEEAGLASAAYYVHVLVDEARSGVEPAAVGDLHVKTGRILAATYGHGLLAAQQQVRHAQVLGCVQPHILYQLEFHHDFRCRGARAVRPLNWN